ncbi:hypothetical protein FRC06_009694 [Ceratobasidium sp. 370]|nr:hypothetical protein FRC06_009694 [Ceratobasidium sp. 370]
MKDAQLAFQAELLKLKDQLLAEKERTIAALTGRLRGTDREPRARIDELGSEDIERRPNNAG